MLSRTRRSVPGPASQPSHRNTDQETLILKMQSVLEDSQRFAMERERSKLAQKQSMVERQRSRKRKKLESEIIRTPPIKEEDEKDATAEVAYIRQRALV